MGSEQSHGTERQDSNVNRRDRRSRINPSNVVTQNESQRILELQQQLYEARLRELSQAQDQNRNSTQSSASLERNRTPYSLTHGDLQNRVRESNTNSLYPNLATNQFQSPTMAGNSTADGFVLVNSNAANSLERNRTPYSFTHGDLQNRVRESNTNSLYPNIATNQFQSPTTAGNSTTDGFVLINSNAANGFAPSAPPDLSSGTGARSRSRPRRPNQSNDLDAKLCCPICHVRFGMVIYQCSKGHSACAGCRSRNAICYKADCRQRITDIRNRTLESMMGEMKVPCPNSDEGCSLTFKMADMEFHMKECPFGEIVCPFAHIYHWCHWTGKVSLLAQHCDEVHSNNRQADVDKEMSINNICSYNQSFVNLVSVGVYNFLVCIKTSADNKLIYMTVKMIGTKHSAEKWSYEFQVYNKREPRRKFVYTDTCLSTVTTFDEIFSEGNCATIPLAYAKNFVNDGNLMYKFFIKKNDEVKRAGFGGNQRGHWRGRGRGRGAYN